MDIERAVDEMGMSWHSETKKRWVLYITDTQHSASFHKSNLKENVMNKSVAEQIRFHQIPFLRQHAILDIAIWFHAG